MQTHIILIPVILLGTCPLSLSALQKYRHQRPRPQHQHPRHHHQHLNDNSANNSAKFASNIAQKSAQQAHQAVSVQHASGQQASFIASSVLANAAIQAAARAEVVVTSKHALLENLEKLRIDTYHTLAAELVQLEQAKHAAALASRTAKEAANQISTLTKALKHSQRVAHEAAAAAEHARDELAEQEKMVMRAKIRLEAIEHKLQEVQTDLAKTKDSAKDASSHAYDAYQTVIHVGEGETYGSETAQPQQVYYTVENGAEVHPNKGYGEQEVVQQHYAR